ncbi:MAG: nicotinamidase [Candidatus Zixiibacteriota bacterium]|nr:MAG: nicotinamidase [candidate division Zixibacteria bacterium]
MPYRYDIHPDTDALIVVDVQPDFMPGGPLAVPDGDAVIPIINRLIPAFDKIYYTRDWHPYNHISFSEFPEYRDGSWPPHCLADSPGAHLHEDLIIAPDDDPQIISKGTDPEREAYSGFEGTDLDRRLRLAGVRRVFVAGLATDYCVKNTVLDALKRGFQAVVVEDATRGVNQPAGNVAQALDEMVQQGAEVITAKQLVTAPRELTPL